MSIERVPVKVIVSHERATAVADSRQDKYGGVAGTFVLEGELLKPRCDTRHDVVALFMHPTASMTMLPFTRALTAQLGLHVLVGNSRFSNNDSALVAEKCVLDVGHFVRHLRHVLGYNRVLLFGWSGGGALMALYQSQASRPTIRTTPSGDPVHMERAKLIPGDQLILVAAHTGRARFLRESLDPTIWLHTRNDRDFAARQHAVAVQELQLYAADNTRPTPPYNSQFLKTFRAAQEARMQRITAWARSVPPHTPFVVEGTMADPRWLDLSIDRNERTVVGSCFLGKCVIANDMPTGLARFCTARSWLSQWADGVSELDALKHLPCTDVPTLVIVNGADDGVPRSHGTAMFAAIPHNRKHLVEVQGATHYFIAPAGDDGVRNNLQTNEMTTAVREVAKFVAQWSRTPLDELRRTMSAPTFPARVPSSTGDMRGPSRGFSHVALVCSDMNVTIKFYTRVLGMPVVKTIALPDGGQHFFLDCGDHSGGTLAFFWWPQPRPHAPGVATASKVDMARGTQPRSASGSLNHIAFQIAEADIPPFRQHIQAKGVWVSPVVLHADNETGYTLNREDPEVIMLSMYLWGPDGELIEFSACTDKMFPTDMNTRVQHEPGMLPLRQRPKSKL